MSLSKELWGGRWEEADLSRVTLNPRFVRGLWGILPSARLREHGPRDAFFLKSIVRAYRWAMDLEVAFFEASFRIEEKRG